MTSVKHFVTDNKKYSNKSSRVNVNNPEFTPTVSVNGIQENTSFLKNQGKWADLVAYYR